MHIYNLSAGRAGTGRALELSGQPAQSRSRFNERPYLKSKVELGMVAHLIPVLGAKGRGIFWFKASLDDTL